MGCNPSFKKAIGGLLKASLVILLHLFMFQFFNAMHLIRCNCHVYLIFLKIIKFIEVNK